MSNSQPTPLTDFQLDVLRRFAIFEASMEEVQSTLRGVFRFDFERGVRTAETLFRVPEPGVLITRGHVETALNLKRHGKISEPDLALWATMLLVNDAYELDPEDEDFIAEWLSDLSYCLNPPD
jgi:hypothetical protein